MTCDEALHALAPFEDERSHASNSERCRGLGRNVHAFEPTFTSRVTVTYTFTVKVNEQGRVESVSPLAVW
jgi:hypothetical protein